MTDRARASQPLTRVLARDVRFRLDARGRGVLGCPGCLARRMARGFHSTLALAALIVGLALQGCGSGATPSSTEGLEWIPLHPATHEPAVAALVLSTGMQMPGEEPGEDHPLAVALWADGTLLWSATKKGGYGAPYREARLAADASEKLRSDLQRVMLERGNRMASYGVADATAEVLLLRDGARVWRMSSCIDLFEANPGVVAFSGGIAARDSMPSLRDDDPAELALRDFRAAWTTAKQALLSVVPDLGTELPSLPIEFRAIGEGTR